MRLNRQPGPTAKARLPDLDDLAANHQQVHCKKKKNSLQEWCSGFSQEHPNPDACHWDLNFYVNFVCSILQIGRNNGIKLDGTTFTLRL